MLGHSVGENGELENREWENWEWESDGVKLSF